MLNLGWSILVSKFKLFFQLIIVTIFVCTKLPIVSTKCTPGVMQFASITEQIAAYTCQMPNFPALCDTVSSRYYTADGSCNNPVHGHWGQTHTGYARLLPGQYNDGIMEYRKASDGNPLPLARLISTTIFRDENVLSNNYTILFYGFGQFVDHDIAFSGSMADDVECCKGFSANPDAPEDICMHTIIPPTDPYYSHLPSPVACINAKRSANTRKQECTNNKPVHQINQASPWLDLSIFYGNSEKAMDAIRSKVGGQLLTDPDVQQSNNLKFPLIKSKCPIGGLDPHPEGRCFKTGDQRTQQNPEIAINQLTFLRYHNFLAEGLAQNCPDCSDEILFQEARRIAIGTYQHVVFNEMVPSYVGIKLAEQYNLLPLSSGYATGYDTNVNGQCLTEYAAAAGRLLHSLIKGSVSYQNSSKQESYDLKDKYFNQSFLLDGDTCSNLIAGYAKNTEMELDQFMSIHISRYLFLTETRLFGQDLVSVDINRGRDHGVPTYNQARDGCGLCAVDSFEDLRPLIRNPDENIAALKSLYKSINDVDLYVLALLELPVPGAIVGPTAACIYAEQFRRTKFGDRLFYEFPNNFTPDQLNYIRTVTYSKILCLTQNIDSLQQFSFIGVRESNPVVSCSALRNFNFSLFSDFFESIGTVPENALASSIPSDQQRLPRRSRGSNRSSRHRSSRPSRSRYSS